MLKPGRYKHYRGGVYVVLLTAKSSDNDEPMVVYMNEVHGTYYVRSLREFTDNVVVDDIIQPRFELLSDK